MTKQPLFPRKPLLLYHHADISSIIRKQPMDNIWPAVGKLLISFVLGAVIGLERDTSHAKSNHTPHSVAGLRTFSVIAVLGALAGFLSSQFMPIALALSAALFLMIVVFYVMQSWQSKDLGMTTEIVMLYSFILGFLISAEVLPVQLLLAVSIVIVLVLSRKDEIRKLTFGLHREELNAFISYAMIALVVLPFLPNRGFSLSDIGGVDTFLANYGINLGAFLTTELINPFKLWMIVALITGIDIAGYVLGKTIGKTKGRLVSSMVGGFVSSTATTQALAQESKKSKSVDSLVMAALFANFVSFFPVFLLIASVNSTFLVHLTPTLLALLASSFGMGLFFAFRSSREKHITTAETPDLPDAKKDIFSLRPALNFALLFLCVRLVTQAALIVVGQSGFLVASALAALTGIDAATINVSELAGSSISLQTAVLAFVMINAVNLLAKTVYSFLQAKREFAIKFGASMAVIVIASLAGFLFA